MSTAEDLCAKQLKLLSDANRLAVVKHLAKQPVTVTNLARELNIEQSLLSHHLRKLRDGGLVKTSIQGNERVYSLSSDLSFSQTQAISLGCCTLTF